MFENIKKNDFEIHDLILKEKERQMSGLELIPSENLVSKSVLEALGSYPVNKYAEGYPGKRYYGGNEFIDKIEQLAINRLKLLFNAEHANVQPNSGSPANMAVYFALLSPGDKALGLKLTEGGHLTHGHKVNFSGKTYNFLQYGVDKETEMLNYDSILEQARKERPKLILSGYTAYPRKINFKKFRKICDEVGAFCMADISHIGGLCATGVHENPVPFFDVVTTTTHKTLRGPRSAVIMCKNDFAEKIDKAVFPGLQGGPHEHVITAKAVAFKEALQPEFKNYCEQIVSNAKKLADSLQSFGYRIVSNGTDTHLILVDVRNSGISGIEAEKALELAGIYCNKNTIPFETGSPWDPSGIRIGTPTLTTRGMKESEMVQVAEFIHQALLNKDNSEKLKLIKEKVKEFCSNYIFYK
ncbi:MAG: serine hydroxymethyltransferase [Candidatus ainarchaeum sp.]|nr:serine hydroxymethyltransferase [Candidatus ainarchaeum sp.]